MTTSPYASRFAPVTPPPDLAAHTAQMRRWTFLMIGGTLLLAIGFVGVQIYLLKSLGKPSETERDKQPPAWASQTPLTSDKPLSAPRREDAPKTDQEALLAVVGSLTGAHLYQTFLNIGLLADAVEHNPEKPVYSLREAKGVLEKINEFIDYVEKQLIQVPPSAFKNEDDRKDMELARTVTTLLRTQTKELKAYWDTGDKEHADRYLKARTDAWVGIKKLAHVEE